MIYHESTRLGLLHFAKLGRNIRVMQNSDSPLLPVRKRKLSSCLVTVVEQGYAMLSTRPTEGFNHYVGPTFWRQPDVVQMALRLLVEDIPDPVVWIIGEYLDSELREWSGNAPLPSAVREALIGREIRRGAWTSFKNVILRLDDLTQVPLPCQQGFGHFPGVSFAVFARETEPTALYEEWVAGIDHNAAFVIGTDARGPVPAEAVGWLSPYGEENRDHATLAKAHWDPTMVAERFARDLGLPLISSQCPVDAFMDWEWDCTPPADVRDVLNAAS